MPSKDCDRAESYTLCVFKLACTVKKRPKAEEGSSEMRTTYISKNPTHTCPDY